MRVLRARRTPGRSLRPSSTARCASKGSNQAAPESERAVPGGVGSAGVATRLPLGVVDQWVESKESVRVTIRRLCRLERLRGYLRASAVADGAARVRGYADLVQLVAARLHEVRFDASHHVR